MHTLILNGSPHKNGDTAAMIAALREHLHGEITQIDCYRAEISPCTDCRWCTKNPGCAIRDAMQDVYPILETCDNIVIASPVYFSLPTAPVLSVASRIQTYFCQSFFRKSPVPIAPKRGGIILAGGGSGSAEPAEATARRLLKYMKAKQIGPVAASLATDRIPAREDAAALEAARSLAAFLNGFQE
jgi:multimeric flavodoxin WrbA